MYLTKRTRDRLEDVAFLRSQGVTNSIAIARRLGLNPHMFVCWLYRQKQRGLYPYPIDNRGVWADRQYQRGSRRNAARQEA